MFVCTIMFGLKQITFVNWSYLHEWGAYLHYHSVTYSYILWLRFVSTFFDLLYNICTKNTTINKKRVFLLDRIIWCSCWNINFTFSNIVFLTLPEKRYIIVNNLQDIHFIFQPVCLRKPNKTCLVMLTTETYVV